MPRHKAHDYTGQTVHYWEVLERVKGRGGKWFYRCRCTYEDCGVLQLIRHNTLQANGSKMCRACSLKHTKPRRARFVS